MLESNLLDVQLEDYQSLTKLQLRPFKNGRNRIPTHNNLARTVGIIPDLAGSTVNPRPSESEGVGSLILGFPFHL